ncbi:hypothetical protein [Streptomyces sp. SAS_272]|uniref:hypothetical protein n=1 Tax=Streptomyces sp. SAS_272 TaxID=3412747 RepID=UPI00403C4369
MSDNEILMLCSGIALGGQGMNLLHAYWASKDAQRAAVRARVAAKQARGDQYLNSLRLYQLQHRSRV